MTEAIRRWLRLSWEERRVVAWSCALFPIAALSLRAGGVSRARDALRSLRRANVRHGRSARIDALRWASLVESTADTVRPRPLCLVRSLVLEALLHHEGVQAQLRLGARRERGFEAHAWVELNGVALNDAAGTAASFSPFVSRSEGPPSD